MLTVPDFDDFADDIVLHNSKSLLVGDASGDEFDDIASLDDRVWIPGFLGGPDCHRPFQEIQFELDARFHQPLLYDALALLYVFFTILGE